VDRGICALPYKRLRDDELTYFPVNIIGNLYVSNGMAAGNTMMEARSQALSEIYERHIKYRIISEGLCLPDVPEDVIARYPKIASGIKGLRDAGFGILIKDASYSPIYGYIHILLNQYNKVIYLRNEHEIDEYMIHLLVEDKIDASS
jgi:ribosomal protein S12 methylthiotransferase accessory factor